LRWLGRWMEARWKLCRLSVTIGGLLLGSEDAAADWHL